MVEISVPIRRPFDKARFLAITKDTLNDMLGTVHDVSEIAFSACGLPGKPTALVAGSGVGASATSDWIGLTEEELEIAVAGHPARVHLAVVDYGEAGPKEELDHNTEVASVITPVGDRVAMAWALAVSMAIVAAEMGDGTVVDEYGIWTGARLNSATALREQLMPDRDFSDPSEGAQDLLLRRAADGRKVLS